MSNLVIGTKVGANDPIVDVVCPADTVGGGILVLGDRNADGTYEGAANAAVTDQEMVLISPVCLPYGAEDTEHDYDIVAGGVERGYVPVKGRKYSVPVANITATNAIAVDAYVVPDAGEIQMECLDALGGTETVQFKIVNLFAKAGVNYAMLLCIKDQ